MGLNDFILNCEKENEELKKDIKYYKNKSKRLEKQLEQRDEVIDETIKYITSYDSIHTFQFGDEKEEDIETNNQFDEKTFNELQRRYLIIHHKLLDILNKYKGDNYE